MKAASIVNEAYFDSHRKYFHFWGRFLNLEFASSLNVNLNGSKELEHYAS